MYKQNSATTDNNQQPTTANSTQQLATNHRPLTTNWHHPEALTLKMAFDCTKLRKAISMFMVSMKTQLKCITTTQNATATISLLLFGAAALTVTVACVPCATYTAGLLSCIN